MLKNKVKPSGTRAICGLKQVIFQAGKSADDSFQLFRCMSGADTATKITGTVRRRRRDHQDGVDACFEQAMPGGQGLLILAQANGNHRADLRAYQETVGLEAII